MAGAAAAAAAADVSVGHKRPRRDETTEDEGKATKQKKETPRGPSVEAHEPPPIAETVSTDAAAYTLDMTACISCNRSHSACKRMSRGDASCILSFLENDNDPLTEVERGSVCEVLLRQQYMLHYLNEMIATGASRQGVAACAVCCVLLRPTQLRPPVDDQALRTCLRLFGRAGMRLETQIRHSDTRHNDKCSFGGIDTSEGETVLGYACRKREDVAIMMLDELKGTADGVDLTGESQLYIALRARKNVTLVRCLIMRSSAALDHSTPTLAPPLFLAIEWFLQVCMAGGAGYREVAYVVRWLLSYAVLDGSGIDLLNPRWRYADAMTARGDGCSGAAEYEARALHSEVHAATQRNSAYRCAFIPKLRSALSPALLHIDALVEIAGQYTVPWFDALLKGQTTPPVATAGSAEQQHRRPAAAAAAAAATVTLNE